MVLHTPLTPARCHLHSLRKMADKSRGNSLEGRQPGEMQKVVW